MLNRPVECPKDKPETRKSHLRFSKTPFIHLNLNTLRTLLIQNLRCKSPRSKRNLVNQTWQCITHLVLPSRLSKMTMEIIRMRILAMSTNIINLFRSRCKSTPQALMKPKANGLKHIRSTKLASKKKNRNPEVPQDCHHKDLRITPKRLTHSIPKIVLLSCFRNSKVLALAKVPTI